MYLVPCTVCSRCELDFFKNKNFPTVGFPRPVRSFRDREVVLHAFRRAPSLHKIRAKNSKVFTKQFDLTNARLFETFYVPRTGKRLNWLDAIDL